jgi:hypothetical protein
MCVNVFTLLYSFSGYHNDEKLNIEFAITMLGVKTVEQLTEAKLVKEVMHFLELKGSLPYSQYPFTGPDSEPNKSSSFYSIFRTQFYIIPISTAITSKWSHSFIFYVCSIVHISSPSYACHIIHFKFYKHFLIKHF